MICSIATRAIKISMILEIEGADVNVERVSYFIPHEIGLLYILFGYKVFFSVVGETHFIFDGKQKFFFIKQKVFK